jgi:hypothetical protein
MYYDMKCGLDARGSPTTTGIQFRLGPGDHKPVADFLSREHAGATAITLDTKAARHQHDAAAGAVDAGLDVHWEPAVERLATPGFGLEKFPTTPMSSRATTICSHALNRV